MEAVKKSAGRTPLRSLPFDQYSRQHLVRELIDKALRAPRQKLHIIDLGGHKGKTADFFPSDKVTILDVFDEHYDGYVKGDATKMTFADSTFDVACSFDVFEHIPRPLRQAFVTEALRVSKLGVFIAMPVDDKSGAVSHAEKALNRLHRNLYGQDHRWLKEHIDYRIPNEAEVEKLLKKADAHFVSFGSNQVADWQLLQAVIFVAARNAQATRPAQQLNEWYNEHLDELEKGVQTGYRRIYFVTRDKNLYGKVKAASKQLTAPADAETGRYVSVHQAVMDKTLEAVGLASSAALKLLKQKEVAEIAHTKEAAKLHHMLNDQNHANTVLRGELAGVYGSMSWRITKPLRVIMRVLRKIG